MCHWSLVYVCRNTSQRFNRASGASGKTGPLAEPPDDEEDCSKNDRKKYEQAYYIGHPARRQEIIDVPLICFLLLSFHVVTEVRSQQRWRSE